MRTIIITLILILVPLTNIEYNVPNKLEQNVEYEIGAASNYTIETITPFSDADRAQYLTFSNRTNGLDIVHYDSYLKVWHIRENTNGAWVNTVLPSQWPSTPSRVHAFEYLSTHFGIFNVDIPNSKVAGNCPANQVIYNISVNNLSNSNLHTQFDFCAPGTTYATLMASAPASVGDDFFSFAFQTCGTNGHTSQAVYQDHLVTIFSNGSHNINSYSQRPGVGGYTSCSQLQSPRVIATNYFSCITAVGSHNGGHSGYQNGLAVQCVNHANNSLTYGGSFCSGNGASCGSQRFYSTGDEIYYLEIDSAWGNIPFAEKMWRFNETGFYELSTQWAPSQCYDTFPHIIGSAFICEDSTAFPGNNRRIWNPANNYTEIIPEQLNSEWDLTSFTAGNIGSHKNWIFIDNNPLSGKDISISWTDYDLDSYHDLVDELPLDSTQHNDLDGDGYGDSLLGNYPDSCPSQFGDSVMDRYGCSDFDGDGYSDLGDLFPSDFWQWNDTDGDGYGDNNISSPGHPNITFGGNSWDDCPNQHGSSTKNSFGCPDYDDDGYSDFLDHFANDVTQWIDSDGDGYGDNPIGLEADSCTNVFGNSTHDRYGCIDSDGDGWSDDGDSFPQNPTQWKDRDGDNYGDNQDENATMSDAFPADVTQWSDTDGDGYGDNPFGTQGDWFPNDPTRWQDSDQDGVADEDDAFPNEITQWNDTDGDGYGDENTGYRADAFPNDSAEWLDSDMDGLGDNTDAFPFDPTQKTDLDGDGMGDNPMGIGADKFPNDATQWGDIDGDGYGDNPNGTTPDAFITDATQWSDEDGDGYGDNPAGRLYDQFPQNPTQWLDEDGDGLGDNQSGTNADPSLNDFDNDGYNDSIDPLPKLSSPGDLDNDGVLDVNDIFPEDAREWSDYDGDGEGDNADTDDDNDGWADTEEERLGTDPFGAGDVPVDSFEIVIPGTAVGLGAWDLIGMFGGIPLAFWIGFGFATRNGRTAKYETLLREAQTRDELEGVARMWEYSLMLRMLGPHQGIRLERLRAELDDKFEAMNQTLSSIENNDFDQTQMVIQEMNDTEKQIPELVSQSDYPSIEDIAQKTDENGYEWFTAQDGTNFYRTIDSQTEWMELEVDSEP